ncbi:MAG TPA: DNA-binding response regulator [Bacteroidales bacterium]|nr:DNA-binding response regulator [Bacteroidales bacterium]
MNKTAKVLIIDDEEPARVLIRSFLESNPDVEICGEAANGFDGLKLIQSLKPDLVFLDIQMPKISGFEMLELLDEYPQIIFSTAFDEYAIRAFEYNAVDYLLKPYSKDRFTQAVDKAIDRIRQKESASPGLAKIASGVLPDGQFLDRIVVRTGQKIKVIPIDQVEFIEAEDDYATIYTPEGRYMKQMTMGYFEGHLDPAEFLRVHRSHIVRISRIVQLEPYDKDTKVLVMQSGKKIHASKAGMKRLRETLGF